MTAASQYRRTNLFDLPQWRHLTWPQHDILTCLPIQTVKPAMRSPLRPFSRHSYPPGQWFSPLDAKAEAAGVPVVEKAFAETPALFDLSLALGRLLNYDFERSQLALKKSLHSIFESRLRTVALKADPPENHGLSPISIPADKHPLDSWLAKGIGLTVFDVGRSERLWHLIELFSLCISLVARATWIGLKFGRTNIIPRICRLFVANDSDEIRWTAINDSLVKMAGFKHGDLLMGSLSSMSPRYETLSSVRIDDCSIPIWPWLKSAIWGSVRLVVAVVTITLKNRNSVIAVEGAIQTTRLSNQVLNLRRLTAGVQIESYIDNIEYDPRHILIKALAPNIKTFRLPHSEMDMPGVGLSYLNYDTFISSGGYQTEAYGNTWYKGTRSVSVGPLNNDWRICQSSSVHPEYREVIESAANSGQRIIVAFGPSSSGINSWHPFLRLLDIALEAVTAHEGWLLVVKPKRKNDLYVEADKTPGMTSRLMDRRVLCLRYRNPGQEVCSAGYLIDKMTLGLTPMGSVVTESLCKNRMSMVFSPVRGETPLQQKLVDSGLFHLTETSFRNALNAFMTNPVNKPEFFKWFRDRFDPFGDDQAINRLVCTLYPAPIGE